MCEEEPKPKINTAKQLEKHLQAAAADSARRKDEVLTRIEKRKNESKS